MRVLILLLTMLAVTIASLPVLHLDRGEGLRLPGSIRKRLPWRVRWQLLVSDAGELFFRRGKSGIFWLTTCAAPAAPTVAEFTSGLRLDKAIADIQGYETQLNRIAQPIWDTNQDIQVDGPQQLGDASMTFLDDDGTGSSAAITARLAVSTLMVEQITGFMVILPNVKTPVAAAKALVFPQKLGARNPGLTMDAQPARYVCQFATTDSIIKDAVVTA